MIREFDDLRAVRESVAQSQAQLAAKLGIGQAAGKSRVKTPSKKDS